MVYHFKRRVISRSRGTSLGYYLRSAPNRFHEWIPGYSRATHFRADAAMQEGASHYYGGGVLGR